MGRKPLLVVSQIGTLVGFAILARAETLAVVFLSRAIDGATAGNLSLAQAYIADVTRPQDRAKAFALIGIAFGIGFLLGPGISGLLAHYDYRYPVYGAMALSFLSILTTIALLPAVAPNPEAAAGPAGTRLGAWQWGRYRELFGREPLRASLGQSFLFFLAFSFFTAGFPLFAERRFEWNGHAFGPREVGLVFAYAGLLGIFIQGGLVGRLVSRWGELPVARAGFASAAIGYVLLAGIRELPLLAATTLFSSFGNGVLRPALTSLVSKSAQAREQGLVLGLSQSLNSVATIIAPILGGLLIERGWLEAWALAPAAICGIGLTLTRKRARTGPPPVEGQKPASDAQLDSA
jgi:MFS family permease